VALRDQGAEIFTVALDAATPEILSARGVKPWTARIPGEVLADLEWASEIFGPERFGAHLICGMGEAEREILALVQRICDMGGHNHIFAFFPERGSLMEDWAPVPRDQWRRVQLARFIIDYAGGRIEDMGFDEKGRVIDFGIPIRAMSWPGLDQLRQAFPDLGLSRQDRPGSLSLQPALR
jgi:biotin synthase